MKQACLIPVEDGYKIAALLESNNSRIYKEGILATQMAEGNEHLFDCFKLAYDPLVTFGVKKVPVRKGKDGPGLSFKTFRILADNLAARHVTGHAAQAEIEKAMAEATNDQWNGFYRRVLIKDMRCGVTAKTINTVAKKLGHKKYMVRLFECQLAKDGADHESKMVGKKLIESKLDGVRVLTFVYTNGDVVQYSRNGKEFTNFEHIKDQFAKVAKHLKEDTVFDGEVMSASFQDLMKQARRKYNADASDAVLNLFDILPVREFVAGKGSKTQTQRSNELQTWYNKYEDDLPHVQVLGQVLVDLSTKEGKAEFAKINKKAIEAGYEGIMIKDPLAKYKCKRSTDWLKQKPFIEVSLEIKHAEEGTGKNEGRLGAFWCEGKDSGRYIGVSVGGGYSDRNRVEFWNNRNKLVGEIIEVRADAITQNRDGTYSLRFPRFLHFRGFAKGEKI